jgi:hypothetical protein
VQVSSISPICYDPDSGAMDPILYYIVEEGEAFHDDLLQSGLSTHQATMLRKKLFVVRDIMSLLSDNPFRQSLFRRAHQKSEPIRQQQSGGSLTMVMVLQSHQLLRRTPITPARVGHIITIPN